MERLQRCFSRSLENNSARLQWLHYQGRDCVSLSPSSGPGGVRNYEMQAQPCVCKDQLPAWLIDYLSFQETHKQRFLPFPELDIFGNPENPHCRSFTSFYISYEQMKMSSLELFISLSFHQLGFFFLVFSKTKLSDIFFLFIIQEQKRCLFHSFCQPQPMDCENTSVIQLIPLKENKILKKIFLNLTEQIPQFSGHHIFPKEVYKFVSQLPD